MTAHKLVKVHKWEAKKYSIHSHIQHTAAMELLKKHPVQGSESVLDVGCGDGKISAKISNSVPLGSVYGVDISSDMIHFAKTHFPAKTYINLSFDIEDANDLDYTEKFDIVFSSFALQWLKDPQDFVKRALRSLHVHGHLLFTIPLGISTELEQALSTIVQQEQWAPFFTKEFQLIKLPNKASWKKALTSSTCKLLRFELVNQETLFSNFEALKDYITQWLPHIYATPKHLQETFKDELFIEYAKVLQLEDPDAEVCFSFARLDIIGKKTSSRVTIPNKKVQ